MSRNKIVIRMLMLVFVTIVFIGAFYVFFKNSRAGSPLNDKEYLEQLSSASRRYQTAGEAIITPTPVNHEPEFINRVLEKLAEFFFNNKN